MKRKMHAKTIAIVLATATALQTTGVASRLVNGEAFVNANAADNVTAESIGSVEFIGTDNNVTTAGAVYFSTDVTEIKEPELNVDKDVVVTIKVFTGSNSEGVTATTTVKVKFGMSTVGASAELVLSQGTVFKGSDNKDYTLENDYTKHIDATLNMTDKPTLPDEDYLTVYNATTPGAVKLTWYKANDDETDQSELKYYLYKVENKYYNSIEEWEINGELLNEGSFVDINEWNVNGLNNTATYYFQLIVEDQQGNKTRYSTERYSQAISKLIIMRNKDSLEALIIGVFDNEVPIDRSRITYSWSIDGQIVGNEKLLPMSGDYVNKNITLTVSVNGYPNTYTDSYLPSIDTMEMYREGNSLTVDGYDYNGNLVTGDDFKLEYEWSVDGQVISTDKYIDLTNYYDKRIAAKVTVNGESSVTVFGTFTNVDGVSAKISGNVRVGNTLEAVINDMNKSLDFTYSWWRIDDQNADSIGVESEKGRAVKVGEEKEYTLTSEDRGKYIRLVVCFKDADGKYREIKPIYTTSQVVRQTSSSGSSSSSSSSGSSNSSTSASGTGNTTSDNTAVSNTTSTVTETAKVQMSEDGKIKLVNKDGQAATGWQQVEGKWYLADLNGIAQTGWQQANGVWYLLENNGVMATGWQKVNDKWYFLNNSGSMATGWQSMGNKWYLLNSDGKMATGWQQTNGKWYYLNGDGSMASNTVIDGYRVDASGSWV